MFEDSDSAKNLPIHPLLQDSQIHSLTFLLVSDKLVETVNKMNESTNVFEVIQDAEGTFLEPKSCSTLKNRST